MPELLPLRSAAPHCLLLAVFIVALWLRLLPVVVLLLAWGAAVTVSLLPLACLIGVAARDDVQPQRTGPRPAGRRAGPTTRPTAPS